jgi:hypothetical protein
MFVIVTVIIKHHNDKLTAIPTSTISMARSSFREIGPFELEVEAEIRAESEPHVED